VSGCRIDGTIRQVGMNQAHIGEIVTPRHRHTGAVVQTNIPHHPQQFSPEFELVPYFMVELYGSHSCAKRCSSALTP
jgi:hypothetical protein